MKYGFMPKLMWTVYKGTFKKTTDKNAWGRLSERSNETCP